MEGAAGQPDRVYQIVGLARNTKYYELREEFVPIGFFPMAQEVIVTASRQARALSPESILQVAEHHNLRTAPDLREALAMVKDATAEDVIFITGSLFLVAEAREMLVLS